MMDVRAVVIRVLTREHSVYDVLEVDMILRSSQLTTIRGYGAAVVRGRSHMRDGVASPNERGWCGRDCPRATVHSCSGAKAVRGILEEPRFTRPLYYKPIGFQWRVSGYAENQSSKRLEMTTPVNISWCKVYTATVGWQALCPATVSNIDTVEVWW